MNLRITLKALLFVCLLCPANVLFAQHIGVSVLAPRPNVRFITPQMTAQANMTNFFSSVSNKKHNFVVMMMDGTKRTVKSHIYHDKALKKTYLLFINKRYKRSDSNRYQKIYPSQTIYIGRDVSADVNTGTGQAPYIIGNATDSCWMFKVISGPINAYSCLSEMEGEEYFAPGSIVAIQLNDGDVVPYNQKNLRQMVANDPKALRAIENQNYFRAIEKYNKDIEKGSGK